MEIAVKSINRWIALLMRKQLWSVMVSKFEENFGNQEHEEESSFGFIGDQRFLGQSNAFKSIKQTICAIASRKCSIIIKGETGTGKELVARQIHAISDRAENIFIPVDCTTLTGQLFESQLFGHVKGSFTGAVDNTLGFFRAADNGTIFLDEISEIPLDLQAKLLRVLQESRVTPVGSTKPHNIDIRVLCATNRDLMEMVKKGQFREDLYYRLNVVTVDVPPLRDRKDDILLLADYFLKNQADFYNETPKFLSQSAQDLLLNHNWPGNVRELSNAMERAYVLSPGEKILPAVLPMEIMLNNVSPAAKHKIPTIEDAKRKLVIDALEYTGGRKIEAANILGLERRAFNRLIEKYNIKTDSK